MFSAQEGIYTTWAIKTVLSHYAVYIYLHTFNCTGYITHQVSIYCRLHRMKPKADNRVAILHIYYNITKAPK